MSKNWRIKAGNSTFMHLYGELHQYFSRRLQSTADPSDYVMKVWLAAGRYFKGECSLRYYLFSIARTMVAEHWRKLDRQVRIASDRLGQLIGDLPIDDTSPESAVARTAEESALWSAVWRLREPYRQTIRLKLMDFDDTQIAAMMEVSHHTVRSRLHRGRRLLAGLIEL